MKVAAVQMDVTILEKERNLQKILENLEAAARAGAKLIVFPECALSGYCFTSAEEARPMTETVPGPATDRLGDLTKRYGCTAVVGLLEREGDRIYNAAAVIGPDGVLGTHRKVHLLCLGIDRFDAPGDKPFPVFDSPHAKIGVNICFDCSLPESGRVLKLKGTQVLAIPTNWPMGSDTWQHTPPVRATENHLHVIAANRVGEERGFRFAGHSQIVDCTGKKMAEAGESEETILYGELDIAAADRNRVVRLPGQWEFDRIAARRPEMYGPVTKRQRKQKAESSRQKAERDSMNEWTQSPHVLNYLQAADRIPHRAEGEAVLLDHVPIDVRRILDLGTGDGRLLALLKKDRPQAFGVALDFSSTMINIARQRFARDETVSVVEHNLNQPLPDLGRFDAVVSSFAIHHCPHDRKRSLYEEIFAALEPRGLFCNLEHVASPTPHLHERFYEAIGKTVQEEDPSNKLLDVETQVAWLREIGFEDVDCYWKWLELALLVGVKRMT